MLSHPCSTNRKELTLLKWTLWRLWFNHRLSLKRSIFWKSLCYRLYVKMSIPSNVKLDKELLYLPGAPALRCTQSNHKGLLTLLSSLSDLFLMDDCSLLQTPHKPILHLICHHYHSQEEKQNKYLASFSLSCVRKSKRESESLIQIFSPACCDL